MDIQSAPVVVTQIPEGFKLVFSGNIHINTSWLEREMDKIVQNRPKSVELDLTGTEYISSHGLGVLLNFNNRIKAEGGVVKVVAIPKRTYQLLKTAHLHKVLEVDPGAVVERTG